jgi:hypothetical protein
MIFVKRGEVVIAEMESYWYGGTASRNDNMNILELIILLNLFDELFNGTTGIV